MSPPTLALVRPTGGPDGRHVVERELSTARRQPSSATVAREESTTMAVPMRVGLLDDMSEGPPGLGDSERWIRIAVDDLLASGRLDRDVELVHSYGLGLPSGTAAAVERAFVELVEQDALMIVGPAIGDNAIVA